MGIKTHNLSVNWETGERNAVSVDFLLPGEVEELAIEIISIVGQCTYMEGGRTDTYDVLLVLSGIALFASDDYLISASAEQIIRPPFSMGYRIDVPAGKEFSCVRIRKTLTDEDFDDIHRNRELHSVVYTSKYDECPAYTEEIKSPKTVNRMLLPEKYVPRLAMGMVKTLGPDSVGSHEHPMLEQIFLGLKNCCCICFADGEEEMLLENTLLHIPLGSEHSVSVEPDETLSYIWMDLFLTTEGQRYISEQHKIDSQQTVTESN